MSKTKELVEAESLLLVLTFDEEIRQSLAPPPEEQLLNSGAGAEKLSLGRDTGSGFKFKGLSGQTNSLCGLSLVL